MNNSFNFSELESELYNIEKKELENLCFKLNMKNTILWLNSHIEHTYPTNRDGWLNFIGNQFSNIRFRLNPKLIEKAINDNIEVVNIDIQKIINKIKIYFNQNKDNFTKTHFCKIKEMATLYYEFDSEQIFNILIDENVIRYDIQEDKIVLVNKINCQKRKRKRSILISEDNLKTKKSRNKI